MSTFAGYLPVDTVDEQASDTGMAGPATVANQAGGSSSLFGGSPTRSLIALWALALVTYWFMGWFFRGSRS